MDGGFKLNDKIAQQHNFNFHPFLYFILRFFSIFLITSSSRKIREIKFQQENFDAEKEKLWIMSLNAPYHTQTE
jgi:hypothetical protein